MTEGRPLLHTIGTALLVAAVLVAGIGILLGVGALAAGAIRTFPLGFLQALVARYEDGDLGVWYASAKSRQMLS